MPETVQPGDRKCGFVAVLGAPNAGKSTLVNKAVGAKITIATHKVQTTRIPVRGILVTGNVQIVFVDTPGIFKPRRRLDEAMVKAAWTGAEDADAILVLVDAADAARQILSGGAAVSKAFQDTLAIIEELKRTRRKAILVLNKIDSVTREKLLAVADRLRAPDLFTDVFMVSAETGDGVADLIARLCARMPEGPWLYDEDQLSDQSLRALAAEITREHLIRRLHQELPYAATVETERWVDRKDGSLRLEQTIYIERASQKPIVIGKAGQTIKDIGAKARAELEKLFERRVHLFLNVKVKENWTGDPARYSDVGLMFPDK